MKRFVLFIVLVGIAVMLLTSCARPASNESSTTTSLSESENASVTTQNVEAVSTTTVSQEATAPVDSGVTLESVKQAALDAGYAAEDIQNLEMHTEPRPVRGIYVNYADETLQSQCPVYEFKTAADAKEFAKQVNDSGYSICIVNNTLLAMTDAKYGIILNDNEKSVLESFLKSSFLPYEEPNKAPVSSAKDYAGAASRIAAIQEALDKLVNKSVVIYAKTLSADEQSTLNFITFSLLRSADLSFTQLLNEEQANIDTVVQTWEQYGCTDVKMKHDKPHDYTMTGKRAGMDDPFAMHCVYSPEQDALSISDINGIDPVELFEFTPLGNDQYAFQTLYERAIVGYKDGVISSLVYSLKPRSIELAYNLKTDNVYPNAAGADEAWVRASGDGGFEQVIVFDGTKLQISAVDFTGTNIEFDVEVQ